MRKPKIDHAEILRRLSLEFPNPKSELNFKTHFQLLIAVLLSAQATDVGVNKITPNLFKIAENPKAMVDLGKTAIQKYIASIGLSNIKAKNIYNLCQVLLEKYNGEIPNTRAALESLPGVGRKTANVVLNIAFNAPTIAVDRHIFRLANRTAMAIAKTPLAAEQILLEKIPPAYLATAHHLLLLHARYICTAKNPKCRICCINSLCHYKNKTLKT